MSFRDCAARFALLALLIFTGWAPCARADIANAPGAELRVDLYTYGPGEIYWERFGHDALVLTDVRDGQAIAFNYGLFDFNEKNFIFNFARGRMNYLAAAWPASDDLTTYEGEGRWIVAQRLNLTPDQRARLRDFLVWNVQPANARYRYDYYVANCTTRLRDALNDVLDGALRPQMQKPLRAFTYRSQTDRLMAGQPWLMLVLDLGLGPFADQPLNGWSGSFLPAQLMQTLRSVRTPTGEPLVTSDTRLAEARIPSPPDTPPDLRWPLLAIGLFFGIALALAGWFRRCSRAARYGFAFGGALYALLAGIAGVGMTILWVFTAHRAAWANQNLLLFDPLALLLIPGMLKLARRDARVSRLVFVLVFLMTLAAIAALVVNLTGWLPQRNLPWILLALPIWLGLLCGMSNPLEQQSANQRKERE
ncbi:MAG: lipoprotein N-acyltransferase Lnb domain-containing protein [Rhodanobacteraceae bacterium]